MEVIRRALINKIQKSLESFPCVVLIGARQVGKTTLLRQVLPEANFYDLEKSSDLQIIRTDPEYFLAQTQTPLVIDEAQIEPTIFNALRVVIDANRKKNGRYLLSGSSSPNLLKNISESLAGRVAIIEIPSFSWHEAYELRESIFFENIFDINKLESLSKKLSHSQLMELCLYGSYPEPFLKRQDQYAYQSWQENYIKTYIERDIRGLFPGLDLRAYQRFISMLAFSSGEVMNNAKFATSLDVSQPTIKHYLEIAEGTFLWRRLPAFYSNKKKVLVKSPKGYIRDTGLINYFLKIQTLDQLLSHPNYGYIWEIFVIEQILKNLSMHYTNFDSYFYCSKSKSEVDLIIESPRGLLPIEIKSGSSTEIKKLTHLKAFIDEYSCPFGILINNGERVARLSEKIIQIPAVYL